MSADTHGDRAAAAARLPRRRLPGGRLPRDFVVGLVVLAFCAVAYWITLDFKEAPASVAQNVQPATFPRLVIGVLAALTGALMAVSFVRDSRRAGPVPLMVPATGAAMVAFVIAFDTLGFVPAMALFCAGFPVLWGERRWLRIAAFALAFPAAVYLVFAVALDVHFEPGLLGLF